MSYTGPTGMRESKYKLRVTDRKHGLIYIQAMPFNDFERMMECIVYMKKDPFYDGLTFTLVNKMGEEL